MTTNGDRWRVTPEKVELAIKKLVEAGRPHKIILFGSYVRGETGRNCDLDIMVIASGEVEAPPRKASASAAPSAKSPCPWTSSSYPYPSGSASKTNPA